MAVRKFKMNENCPFRYVHFLNERRVEVMKETPDIGFVDISKKMAAEWTALPQEEKAR